MNLDEGVRSSTFANNNALSSKNVGSLGVDAAWHEGSDGFRVQGSGHAGFEGSVVQSGCGHVGPVGSDMQGSGGRGTVRSLLYD